MVYCPLLSLSPFTAPLQAVPDHSSHIGPRSSDNRLQTLETNFSELEKGESKGLPSELPDPKGLYINFYEDIHKLACNIVCGSYSYIRHNEKQYH